MTFIFCNSVPFMFCTHTLKYILKDLTVLMCRLYFCINRYVAPDDKMRGII